MEESLQEEREVNNNNNNVVDHKKARSLFINFIVFSLTFSITHATVDSVLAYTSAELGTNIGSEGGFIL